METIFEDSAYLQQWFFENEICFIVPYIERNFYEESWEHQYKFMKNRPYFAKKIIEDDMMDNVEKQTRFLDSLAFGKSKIIILEGARGSGKTATASWTINELYNSGKHKNIYFVKKGERPAGFPEWINVVDEVEDVPNGSIAVIDESAIKYSSRNFYKDENKDFANRLVILRHKEISVLVITQHMKMIDINIRRLADVKLFKRGANLTHDDEDPDDDKAYIRQRLRPRDVNECLIEIPISSQFFKFSHGLPDWWSNYLSKSFADFNPELETKLTKQQREQREREKREWDFEKKKELELAKLDKMAEKGLDTSKKKEKIKNTPGPAPGDYI